MFVFNHDGIESLVEEILDDVTFPTVNAGLDFESFTFCWNRAAEDIINHAADRLTRNEVKLISAIMDDTYAKFALPVIHNLNSSNTWYKAFYTVFYLLAQVKQMVVRATDYMVRREEIDYALTEAFYRFTTETRWNMGIYLPEITNNVVNG